LAIQSETSRSARFTSRIARFIAIPVCQGDAFFLQRDNFSVLVDGGRSQATFPNMFRSFTRTNGVDVAICTHNDADHAKGILGFLEGGLRCGELWLPGRWLGALPDVLKPFAEVFTELVTDIEREGKGRELSTQEAGDLPLEEWPEELELQAEEDRQSPAGPSVGEGGWPEACVARLEAAEPWGDLADRKDVFVDRWPYFAYHRHLRLGALGVSQLWSAIDAASRIRSIAIAAFHRGIPVRWFEFNRVRPQGGLAALRPVNAREILRGSPRVGALLKYLALTASNKESLVFWSPPANSQPGVLFTADSDLNGAKLSPLLQGSIATAPHHGSEANAPAYTTVTRVAGLSTLSTMTWVRSDGRFRNRPGRTYRALSSRKICTICQLGAGLSSPKQAICLFSRKGAWTRLGSTRSCTCR
jgi:hypothetical protein